MMRKPSLSQGAKYSAEAIIIFVFYSQRLAFYQGCNFCEKLVAYTSRITSFHR